MPSPAEPPITWLAAARTFAVTLAVFTLGGLLGGWVWAEITEPATYEVVTELPDPLPTGALVTASFGSDVRFLVIATVGGLVCSVVCTALFRLRGLVLLAAVLAGSVLASWLAERTGTALGPPPLSEQAAGAGVGEVLTFPLQIGATGVLLGWPIAAVIGLMISVSALTPVPESTPSGPGLG